MIRLKRELFDRTRPRLTAGVIGFAYQDSGTEFYGKDADRIAQAASDLGIPGGYDRQDRWDDGSETRVFSVVTAWFTRHAEALTLAMKTPVVVLNVDDLRSGLVSPLSDDGVFLRVR